MSRLNLASPPILRFSNFFLEDVVLTTFFPEDRSITELEIRHAVLNDLQTQTAKNSLFYFKNTSIQEPKLQNLRNEISNSGLSVTPYEDPYFAANQIEKSLLEILDRDFPIEYVSPNPPC